MAPPQMRFSPNLQRRGRSSFSTHTVSVVTSILAGTSSLAAGFGRSHQVVSRHLLSPEARPSHFIRHSAVASTLLRVTYGIDVLEADDKYFAMVERITSDGALVAAPGNFPVEAIPQLLHLPSWFPGGGFKRFAADARAYLNASLATLYKTAVDGLASRLFLDILVCLYRISL